MRVSKDYVFIYSSNIGYWVKPLSDEAPIVVNMDHRADVQVDSNDTLCIWEDCGWELTVRTANADPVIHENVCSYFLHETWGPIILFLDCVLQVAGGIRIPIPNIDLQYIHKFYWLNNRLFLFANTKAGNGCTSTMMEIFENRMVVLTSAFDGQFTIHDYDSPDRRRAVDLHNGTAFVEFDHVRVPGSMGMNSGIMDLTTCALTPTRSYSTDIVAVSRDGLWMLDGKHESVYSATQHLPIVIPNPNPMTNGGCFLDVQGDWALFNVFDSSRRGVPRPICIHLVNWPTRQIFTSFPGASDAMFVDGRVLIAKNGALSWYDAHSTPYAPLVRFLYGDAHYNTARDTIGRVVGGGELTNRGEYEFKSIMFVD